MNFLAEQLLPLMLTGRKEEKRLGVMMFSGFRSKHSFNTEFVLQWSDGCKISHMPKTIEAHLKDIPVRIYMDCPK